MLQAALSGGCHDTAKRCEEWAAQGECKRNESFMHKQCAASCGTCDKQHEPAASPQVSPRRDPVNNQQELRCYAWAMAGECQKNPAYMHRTCKDACEKNANKEEA